VKTEVLPDLEGVARRAAAFFAEEARTAVARRGRFLVALSGGTTPARMLELLVQEEVPWPLVHLFQVDERVVAASDPARTFTHLKASLLDKVPIPANQVHPMPVEALNLKAAAAGYAEILRQIAGTPPILDLVHLGLGEDGHTASLVPGDHALDDQDAEVAITGPYLGHRRMTLTFPMLARARRILWLVVGPAKAPALSRLRRGDRFIPAGRLPAERAVIFGDATAFGVDRGTNFHIAKEPS
jgi:6-phosphogluconolactonase